METKENVVHRGVVKFFKGSFGFLTCPEVAEKFGGRDTFVHKNDLNTIPDVGSQVVFRLTTDAKGNPKGIEAVVQVAEEAGPDAPKGKRTGGGGKAGNTAGKETAGDGKPFVKRVSMLLLRGDEVLVLREGKKDEFLWSDFGGKVEAGEDYLTCALRELAEEAEGFLSEKSIELLKLGSKMRYGSGAEEPKIVTLKKAGPGAQAVAVFPLDCEGVELELLTRETPNSFGVHDIKWLSRSHPDLRNRYQTRWPLLRTMSALFPAKGRGRGGGQADRDRSRSRSPRGKECSESEAASSDDGGGPEGEAAPNDDIAS